jgi:hypothetical protein
VWSVKKSEFNSAPVFIVVAVMGFMWLLPTMVDLLEYIQAQAQSAAGYECIHGVCDTDKPDARVAYFTALLAIFTGVLAFATVALFVATFALWQETRNALADSRATSERQAKDTAKAIAEAARSATAMEEVAGSMAINAEQVVKSVTTSKEIADRQKQFGEMQIRAYLSVLIGTGIFQERKKRLRFDARPTVRNVGATPARNVRWKIAVGVLPIPMPRKQYFKLPATWSGGSLIPQQNEVTIFEVLGGYYGDEEAELIKRAQGKALYVWGVVSYEDVFRRLRRVTFCQQMEWRGEPGKEVVYGHYMNRHNRTS